MDLSEVTIAEVLKQAGYATCHVGKWHLGPDAWYPEKQGFDYNIGGCDYGQPPSYFDPYHRDKLRPNIPTLPPRKEGEYLTDREADEAVKFIKQHKDKPFFLYMAHYAVHTPIQAKKDVVAKYESKTPTDQDNATYAAMVESLDDAVGKIVKTLDELKLAENTVIFFTSDNGGLIGNKKRPVTSNLPLRSGKGYPYEGGIREPLIIRWPGVVKAGSISDDPVTSVDYFPTICQVAGADMPSDKVIDGISLVDHLKSAGKKKLDRDAIFWHFPHYRPGNVAPYSIIRDGHWKLIKRYEGKKFELFNLSDDLSEKNDLSKSMPTKVEQLDTKLTSWLADTGAKLPRANPDYQPKR
jgi:arylsulfatase A-like enzyme